MFFFSKPGSETNVFVDEKVHVPYTKQKTNITCKILSGICWQEITC